jgi:outer membrane protein OmpA-like peptidoglycan-associated protein
MHKFVQVISNLLQNKAQKHMKKVVFLTLLLYISGSLYALDFYPPVGAFAGIGPEVNALTRSGASVGGGILSGFDLNPLFSVGQKTAFFHNTDTISALELLGIFRFYLPWLHLPRETDGPFVQAEAGCIVFFEFDEVFPAFSGGLSAGWRFNFPHNWYLEPSLRFGYPHIWGVGVMAGIQIKTENKGERIVEVIKEVEVIVEVEKIVEIEVEKIVEIEKVVEKIIEVEKEIIEEEPKVQVPSVIFRHDYADFAGLGSEVINHNLETLKQVAQLLEIYSGYDLIVEGHSNPTTPLGLTREREELSLIQLSEERARKIVDDLVLLGVDRSRLSYTGAGSSKPVAAYNDYSNVWKNRRVEFILVKRGENNEE